MSKHFHQSRSLDHLFGKTIGFGSFRNCVFPVDDGMSYEDEESEDEDEAGGQNTWTRKGWTTHHEIQLEMLTLHPLLGVLVPVPV